MCDCKETRMKCSDCGTLGKFHSKTCSVGDKELFEDYENLTVGDVRWINNLLEGVSK